MESLTGMLVYIIAAPLVGGLLAGLDRIVSARMQNRVGPPVLQPFYDVGKLFAKGTAEVNRLQVPLAMCHLIFMIATGAFFFAGGDIILTVFTFAVAAIFLIVAAFSSGSPYSFVGAERELIILLSAEPVLLLAMAGIYKVSGTFNLYAIAAGGKPLIIYLPGIFLCFVYILAMKLRKSPFDISYSHHAHQEIVKGITTDLGGFSLAMIEISHWYENTFLLGFIYLFFAFNTVLAAAAVALVYLFEIMVDNTNARVRWQLTLVSAWALTLVLGGGNLIALYMVNICPK
jgi:formate hydrogenlyase subunit 4